MDNYTQLYKIQYDIIYQILTKYPNTNIGRRYYDHEKLEFVFVVEIPEIDTVESFAEFLKSSDNISNPNMKFEKMNIYSFMERLKLNNQNRLIELFNKFFVYWVFQTTDINEKYYFKQIKNAVSNKPFTENKIDSFVEMAFNNLQYAFSKFCVLEFKSHDIGETEFHSFRYHHDMYLTYIFINLAAIIYYLEKNNETEFNKIVESIPIKHYERYRGDEIKEVKSLSKMIKHYRDIVCHKEYDYKIANSVETNNFSLICSSLGLNTELKYASGSLHFENQLVPFIIECKKLLLPNEFNVYHLLDKNGKIFYSDMCFDEDGYAIEKSTDEENSYRIYITKDDCEPFFKFHIPTFINKTKE